MRYPISLPNAGDINLFNPVHDDPAFDPDSVPNDSFGSEDDNEEWVGLYWQDQVTLLDDRLHLLFGGRYDDAEQSLPSFGQAQTTREYTQRYGILYRPSPWLSLYGSYTESFSANVVFSRNRSGELLEPETAEQWEVGAKGLLLDDRLSVTLTGFQLTKENLAVPDPVDPTSSIALGEAQSRGLELDLAGEIAPGWNIISSYTWLDQAEITEDGTLGQEGNRLFNTPEHSASLWSTYTFQNGTVEGLTLGAGVFAASEREGDNANSFEADGYARVDAMARYPFMLGNTRVTAQLNIENVFDTDYIANTGNSRIAGNHPGAPLTALFSLKAEF